MKYRHRLFPLFLFFLLMGYWFLVHSLERIDLSGTEFFIPLPDFALVIASYLHPRVLRHFVPVIIGGYLAYNAAVNMVWRMYDLPDWKGGRDFLRRLRKPSDLTDRPITVTPQNLEEGRQKIVRLRVGGPGLATIPIGMVATTEINGRYYRVIDSGTHALDRFEFIHKVIDLRPQVRHDSDAKFRTKDGFTVTADIGATYRILSDHAAGPQRPYPFNIDTVRKLAYDEKNVGPGKISSWENMPLGQVKGALGGILSKLSLDDLMNLTEQDREPYLTVRVEYGAREKLRSKGIDLIRAHISGIKLPEEVTKQHLKLWRADWETQAHITIADGQAAALEEMEIARAEAEMTMIEAIVEGMNQAQSEGYTASLNEVVALRLVEALEKLAHQTEAVETLPETIVPQLDSIQRGLLHEGSLPEDLQQGEPQQEERQQEGQSTSEPNPG